MQKGDHFGDLGVDDRIILKFEGHFGWGVNCIEVNAINHKGYFIFIAKCNKSTKRSINHTDSPWGVGIGTCRYSSSMI
jgi:hypothetical protein